LGVQEWAGAGGVNAWVARVSWEGRSRDGGVTRRWGKEACEGAALDAG
jgi:hypothetical protein